MTVLIGSIATVLAFLVFLGIVWWAYAPRFKKRHEEDGMIPFLDSKTSPETQSRDAHKPRT